MLTMYYDMIRRLLKKHLNGRLYNFFRRHRRSTINIIAVYMVNYL